MQGWHSGAKPCIVRRMKAIVRTEGGARLRVVKAPASLMGDQVAVRVRAVAICRTDLYAAEGRIKVRERRVLGHEFTGIVDQTGPEVTRFEPGARVVGNPSFHCGGCEHCKTGETYRCAETTFLGLDHDGAFAEIVVVPEWSLWRLPNDISFTVGTFTEPIAAGMAVLEAGLDPCSRVWVFGSGRIAQLTGEILRDAGFSRLELSAELPAEPVDALIETNGLGVQTSAALTALKTNGTLVLKSREPVTFEMPVLEAIRKQVRIIAVKYAPFNRALDFVSRNTEMLETFLDDNWRLEDFEAAFELASCCEEKKICFQMSND